MASHDTAGGPSHVGIIMDGNRRWARSHALDAWKGHEAGAKLLDDVVAWCIELGIRELTLYTLSLQNLKRDPKEVAFLLDILRREIKRLLSDERVRKERVAFRAAGRTALLPQDIQDSLERLAGQTKGNDRLTVTFALCYGGREEIVDAVNALVTHHESVTEESIRHRLWITSEPDLIIRTSGERRTSNFLIWQSAYSEWVFIDKPWPEFTKADLEAAIADYRNRDRRYGT